MTVFIPTLVPIPGLPMKIFVLSAGALGVKPVTFPVDRAGGDRIPATLAGRALGRELGDDASGWLLLHKWHLVLGALILGVLLMLLARAVRSSGSLERMLNPTIFREYDIRGIADRDLPSDGVRLLGQALGTYIQRTAGRKVNLGRDVRLSGPRLHDALLEGLIASSCDVTDVGVVPTPLLYYSVYNLKPTAP